MSQEIAKYRELGWTKDFHFLTEDHDCRKAAINKVFLESKIRARSASSSP